MGKPNIHCNQHYDRWSVTQDMYLELNSLSPPKCGLEACEQKAVCEIAYAMLKVHDAIQLQEKEIIWSPKQRSTYETGPSTWTGNTYRQKNSC